MSKNIAILVLGCATPPYDRAIDAIRDTWDCERVAGVDTYYVYGRPGDETARAVLARVLGVAVPPVREDTVCQIDDVLLVGCGDTFQQQEDCALRKRLIAFDYLTSRSEYDLIYTVCAASYVDQGQLIRHADSLPARSLVSGAISIDPGETTPFISGASMILTADVARWLGRERRAVLAATPYGRWDDVALGHWVASRMSRVPLNVIVEDVKNGRPMAEDYVLFPQRHTTVDFVLAELEDLQPQPNAFHYHFPSRKPDHMVHFHRRFFAPEPGRG